MYIAQLHQITMKNQATTTILRNNDAETQHHKDEFRKQVNRRSDKLINYFLACYFIAGLVFASFYDTWTIAIGVGGLSLVAYYSVKKLLPDTDFYQYILSTIFGVFMAQFIYQMHGLFEMHFFAFIGSAILITYQNWKLQIPMLLVVIVHHVAFGYLQNSGVQNVYFTQLDSFELQTFIIHFLLAAVIFFVCGLWAHQLKKYSDIQISNSVEMANLQKEALMAATAKRHLEEQEQVKQALAESNTRFSYAAQATSDAIWDRSYTDSHVFWSDGFRLLFGYEINRETTSINFWESKVHPDDLSGIIQLMQKVKDDPRSTHWTAEYRFLKSDGEYAFVREKALVIRDANGKAARTIGALQDITEIKQNEIKLQNLNESLEKEKYFLDSLMDNMPDAIYFKDLNSKFIRVSKHMANKFGVSLNDIIGKSDFDFHQNGKAIQAFKDEQDIMRTRVPKVDYIEKSIHSNGVDYWVSSTKMPLINTRGELVGVFGISRDVTEVKRLEEESHVAKVDKAVAQGKFEIASDVMHDIGNAVVGFGSYLTRIRRMQEKDNPENLRNLAMFFETNKSAINTAIGEAKASAVVKMLAGIALTQRSNHEEINKSIGEQFGIITHIQEILDIQRQYIAGHESQERKPVNLKNIVNDSLAMLFAAIDKKAIAVSLEIADDLPIIKGDRTKLTQVMLNVFRNSVEAIDKDAEEKTISVSVAVIDGELVIRVRDSGKGFDKTIGDQLFNKGFTTKATTTGMGLYGCRTILETHKATIAINSEGEDKGATARIVFNV
jgi:PAS domain S-box-containing protein